MNNLIFEIFDVYSQICNGIAQVLLNIYETPAKPEASLALQVVKKAATHVEDLTQYFEICREMGVLNASQSLKLEKIPEEDIKDLEKIINGSLNLKGKDNGGEMRSELGNGSKRGLKTVITDKWERFDADCCSSTTLQAPFASCSSSHLSLVSKPVHKQDLPDLITF